MPHNKRLDAEEQPSGNPGLSLKSIVRTVWKRKVSIVSVWVLLSLAAVIVIRRLPAIYLAESLILVDSQKIPEKFVSATVATTLDDRIAAIRQQILSSGELKKIITDFNLYSKERKKLFEEEILELMRRDISIELVTVGTGLNKRPGAFRIGYQAAEPTVAARVANRLTDLYVEQNVKTRESQAEGTSEFLDTQLKEAKKRLDALEASVSEYKLKHNGELPQQEPTLTGALARLHTRLQANMDAVNRSQQNKIIQQSALAAAEANEASQVQALEGLGPGAAAAIRAGAQPPPKRSEILEQRLDLLLTQYTEDYSEVKNTRAAIEVAKRSEEQEEARELSRKSPAGADAGKASVRVPETPELARTREQIAGLKAQITVADADLAARNVEQQQILREIDRYQRQIERLPVREQEMALLTRDYEISKDNYKSLLDKQNAAAMSLDMERRQQSERFTILDRATVPEKPVRPNRPLLSGLASAGSLFLGLFWAFSLELRRNVFLGEWELPEGATVLARLPYIEVPLRSTARPPRGHRIGRKKGLAATA